MSGFAGIIKQNEHIEHDHSKNCLLSTWEENENFYKVFLIENIKI